MDLKTLTRKIVSSSSRGELASTSATAKRPSRSVIPRKRPKPTAVVRATRSPRPRLAKALTAKALPDGFAIYTYASILATGSTWPKKFATKDFISHLLREFKITNSNPTAFQKALTQIVESHPALDMPDSARKKLLPALLKNSGHKGQGEDQQKRLIEMAVTKKEYEQVMSAVAATFFLTSFESPEMIKYSLEEKEAAAVQLSYRLGGKWPQGLGTIKKNTRTFWTRYEAAITDFFTAFNESTAKAASSPAKITALGKELIGCKYDRKFKFKTPASTTTISVFTSNVLRRGANIVFHLEAGKPISKKDYRDAERIVERLKKLDLRGTFSKLAPWVDGKSVPPYFRDGYRGQGVTANSAIGKAAKEIANDLSMLLIKAAAKSSEVPEGNDSGVKMSAKAVEMADKLHTAYAKIGKLKRDDLAKNSRSVKGVLNLVKYTADSSSIRSRMERLLLNGYSSKYPITKEFIEAMPVETRKIIEAMIQFGLLTGQDNDSVKDADSKGATDFANILSSQMSAAQDVTLPLKSITTKSGLVKLLVGLSLSKPKVSGRLSRTRAMAEKVYKYTLTRRQMMANIKSGAFAIRLPEKERLSQAELESLAAVMQRRIATLEKKGYEVIKKSASLTAVPDTGFDKTPGAIRVQNLIDGVPLTADEAVKLTMPQITKALKSRTPDELLNTSLKIVRTNPLVLNEVLPQLTAAQVSKNASKMDIFGQTNPNDLAKNGVGLSKSAYRDILSGKNSTLSVAIESIMDIQAAKARVTKQTKQSVLDAAKQDLVSSFSGDHGMGTPDVLAVWDVGLTSQLRTALKKAQQSGDFLAVRAYHGTSTSGANCIISSGFRCSPEFVKAGRAMGDVTYFAPNADKSLQYIGDRFTRQRTQGIIMEGYLLLTGFKTRNSKNGAKKNFVHTDRFRTEEIGVPNANVLYVMTKAYLVESARAAFGGSNPIGMSKNRTFHVTTTVDRLMKKVGN